MTYRRQVLVVLAGFLLTAAWASGSSAHSASNAARHGVVIDSTNYQSVEQLLSNTQVFVVAKVESVAIDHSAPASQPASVVTLKVKVVVRGHLGKEVVVWQPRGARSQVPPHVQTPLQRGRTYLLCLARVPKTRSFFVVGGNAGEFAYNGTTQTFTTLDPLATWEPSNFPLSLAKTGAGLFPAGGAPQPSWLTSPSGPPGTPSVSWSVMVNDLGLSLTDVSCPSESMCVFAGAISPPNPGQQVPAVAVSTGPFSPHASVVGTTTTFPPSSNYSWSSVDCPGPGLCVLSTVDGIYVTTDPTTAHWTLEVAPSPDKSFGQVACPTVSFCAVAAGSGVLVSATPSGGSSAWSYIRIGLLGLTSLSCPSAALCVAGGSGDATVGGWIETTTDPLAAATWHGGRTKFPSFAQHSGQYSVSGISCPTTGFCVAAVVAGNPLVSTDPAGGVQTWNETTNGTSGTNNPGFAMCTPLGHCSVSGVGSFQARGSARGPGVVGYPLPGVSCVSTSFCITTTDGQLAVGKVTG
jgi:hypothetical protein